MARTSTKVLSAPVNGRLNGYFNGHPTSTEKRPLELDGEDIQPSKRTKLPARTDYSRWRLLDEKGRLTWRYLKDDEQVKTWPQTIADKYFLDLPLVKSSLMKNIDLTG